MRGETINLRGSEIETRKTFIETETPEFKKRSRRGVATLVAAVILGIIVLGWLWSFIAGGMVWRAVFLTNNQVYFGHFWDVPFASAITLRDVYYLQVGTPPGEQLSDQSQSQLKLVKLGNEIHGPTSEMVIPMAQVLFWETLRSDSAIVQTIQHGQTSQ